MKKFIKKIVLFILPLITIAVTAEVLLRNMPNDYKYKKQYLDKKAGKIEILILGNSHTLYGLDPVFFKGNVFNAAHVSQSLDCDLALLKKYADSLKNLKTIIIPISSFSFFEKLENTPGAWRLKNYALYYGLNNYHSLTDFSEVLSVKPALNFKRLYGYYINHSTEISCSGYGWGTSHNSKDAVNLVKTGKEAALRHTLNINSETNKKNYNELVANVGEIIKWCAARNINVVLFTPPAYSEYYKRLSKQQLDITHNTARKLMLAFNNCTYLDLMQDSRFTSHDFYDADHLSEKGAKKLSVIMNDTIAPLNSRNH